MVRGIRACGFSLDLGLALGCILGPGVGSGASAWAMLMMPAHLRAVRRQRLG